MPPFPAGPTDSPTSAGGWTQTSGESRFHSPGRSSARPPRSSHRHGTKAASNSRPDGRRIVFHSDRSGSSEIWVCDASGGNPLQLTSLGRSNTGTPRWSPDGRRIAFDARLGRDGDIHVMDADGGAPRRVTTEPSDDVVPSWSRDGRWIYFASNRSGRWEVWKVAGRRWTGGAAHEERRLRRVRVTRWTVRLLRERSHRPWTLESIGERR